jgi:hypothetical protein
MEYMKFCLWFTFLTAFMLVGQAFAVVADRDIYADTWVAQDALGRSMPAFTEV